MAKRLFVLAFALVLIAVTGIRFSSSAEADGGRPHATTMNGAEEVNAQGVPNQGDPDGSGSAHLTFNPGLGEICFELTVENIALPATAAHIHEAPIGVAGPVVVPLTAPDASGVSSGCVSADPALVKDILKHPSDYYVNVHNSDFQAGAVRGQLGD
jgi:CHRD domain